MNYKLELQSNNNDLRSNSLDLRRILEMINSLPEKEIVYEQLVNYTMLYYMGDECVDVTNGWTSDGYSGDTWSVSTATKNADNILTAGPTTPATVRNLLGTNKAINIKDYNGIFAYAKNVGRENGGDYPTLRIFQDSKTNIVNSIGFSNSGTQWMYTNSLRYNGEGLPQKEWLTSPTPFKDINVYINVIATYRSERRANWYTVFLTKEDDWKELCSIAGINAPHTVDVLTSDIDAVTAILNNEKAVQYMIKQCTGDFMAHAIQSEAFLNALLKSSYKNIVETNSHWAKFLAIIEYNSNIKVLYDYGDECENVTGGWVVYNFDGKTANAPTKNADNMHLSAYGTSIGINNAIDLTNYSIIWIDANVEVAGQPWIAVTRTKDGSDYVATSVTPATSGRQLLQIHVSQLTGTYYLAANLSGNGGGYIYKVWLE